ncbi:MAG: phospho-sugar mutase, partial [Actinobacteria bacterium]|nr:phospho-sugar mutase [Actinomycetota bacterium]
MDKKLEAEVRAWIDDDPDDETRAQLVAALATNNEEQLRSWFAGFLEFGTAGLRGPMGPGPSQMNRAVVGRTALGLASYMKARGLTSIAIGYDARHRSYRFALDTAELMAGAGIAAHVMPRTLPTPVLAYAVNHLKVDAGVMVTASHNPPEDNGYKVYLGGIVDGIEYRGSQIIAPADREIAEEIASITSLMSAPRSNSWQTIDESVIDAYRAATLRLGTSGEKSLRTVHTALHGVGTETFMKVVKAAGFSDTISVSEQAEPDPDFPTVAFPNPEEKGAIDLAIALAIREDADLVIANDPD